VKEFSKNKLHLADRIGFDNYHYEEEIPVLEWELGEDTLTVCGYPCKKARTAFRGRNYEAWYAPEIPVSLGPWKFAGLPGMILQIRDTRNMFRFVCTQITIPEEAALMDIEHIISKKRFNLVKKSKYVEDKQKFMDNAGAFVTGSPVIRQIGPLPPHNYVKKPFNPIELTED
jgi:GLPGLI family protein